VIACQSYRLVLWNTLATIYGGVDCRKEKCSRCNGSLLIAIDDAYC
jgi:hypothetical protein